MDFEPLLRLDFGNADGDPDGLLAAWEAPVDGRRWARGRRSTVTVPRPATGSGVILALVVDPYLVPPVLPQQTLRVLANGRTLRLSRPSHRTVVVARIDADVLDERPSLELGFEHPDIVQPNMVSASSDSAGYSIGFVSLSLLRDAALPRRAGVGTAAPSSSPPSPDTLSETQLMMQFASIGDNCEFGMAQRAAGAEPADLFRFAGIEPLPLLNGIETALDRISDINHLEFDVQGNGHYREYILHNRFYTLDMHTRVLEGAMPVERLIAREVKKLAFLQRLFLEDLATGRRIFVYKRNDGRTPQQILDLHASLRRHGPNTLFFVSLSDAAHPPGTIETLSDGLYRGYIDRFSRYDDAGVAPSPMWLELCRHCYGLWYAAQPAGTATAETAALRALV